MELTKEFIQITRTRICEVFLNETLKSDYIDLMNARDEYKERISEIREEHAGEDRDDYIEEIEEAKEEYPISGLYMKWNNIEDKTMLEKKEVLEAVKEYNSRTSEEIKMDFLKKIEQVIIELEVTYGKNIAEVANIYIDEFLN